MISINQIDEDGLKCSAFRVQRSAFRVQRFAFRVQRSALSVQRSALSVPGVLCGLLFFIYYYCYVIYYNLSSLRLFVPPSLRPSVSQSLSHSVPQSLSLSVSQSLSPSIAPSFLSSFSIKKPPFPGQLKIYKFLSLKPAFAITTIQTAYPRKGSERVSLCLCCRHRGVEVEVA